MKESTSDSENKLVTREAFGPGRAAFTLIELLVVMATLGVLFAVLLPALAGTQSQPKVTACATRFRQWAISANLYANDNRGLLPSFNPAGGGQFAYDVGTNMLYALYPYGMDVPDYFCPMRPNEWDAVNGRNQTYIGHPIRDINDLTYVLGVLDGYPGELLINDNYWVPRSQGSSSLWPPDYSTLKSVLLPPFIKQGMPTSAIYGWPQKLHDVAVSHVPFVSDKCGSGTSGGLNSPIQGTAIADIAPNTAHFVNGVLIGVNLAYADGHVEDHNPSQMRCVAESPGGGPFWFY